MRRKIAFSSQVEKNLDLVIEKLEELKHALDMFTFSRSMTCSEFKCNITDNTAGYFIIEVWTNVTD
jgi:hypothetical protein